jgi:cholesterol oxidase
MTREDIFDYDYIVIGSGFGGSVSALRLSEKGYRVAVLEKGKRWPKETFPKTNWNTRKYMWLPQLGCYGYQMLTQLKHVLIFHGGGVGGGSLVYANQLLIPPDEVFQRPEWGIADCKETMMPHYQEARRMLGANPSPQIGRADQCLRQVGIDLRGKDTFHKNDVGIFFGEPDKTVPDPYFGGAGRSAPAALSAVPAWWAVRWGRKIPSTGTISTLPKATGAGLFLKPRSPG